MMTVERPTRERQGEARNGLEPMRRPAPERWVCDGFQPDGRPCRNVLMEVALTKGYIRVRCRKCGTWHTRVVS